jgi:hypothetical protein
VDVRILRSQDVKTKDKRQGTKDLFRIRNPNKKGEELFFAFFHIILNELVLDHSEDGRV